MLTYGMLLIYYRFFHPWKSEGVSVGFMPGNVEKNSIHENDLDSSFNKWKKTSISPPKKCPWRFFGLNKGIIKRLLNKQKEIILLKAFHSTYVSIDIYSSLLETSYYEESTWATGVWQDHSKIEAKIF